ncbi:MAG: PAS domain S-box protein, partial [Chthoniobacterales bacterium]|nr:PAS domain S-box protein [Chthoniobacterales bacterium]
LDWMMPKLSGAEVLEQLRVASEPGPYLPILVITALPQFTTRKEALGAGATDFLNKPYDAAEIVLRVGNLLATRFLQLELIAQNQSLEKRVEERTAELSKANAALQRQSLVRERAAQAAVQITEEWEQSFDAVADHICILDLEGKIVRANRTMRERFEPIHGPLTGVDYRLCYCGSATPDPEPPCAEVLVKNRPVVWEGELPTIAGWHWIAAYPLSEQGVQWGAISVVRDMTARKEAEQALREAQEELEARVRDRTQELEAANSALSTQSIISKRAEKAVSFQAHMLESISEAVIATDPVGKILYVNQFAERLYGWPAHEMIGRDVVEIIVPQPSREKGRDIMEALKKGQTWSGEFLVQRRDGTTFPAAVTDSPLFDESGNLTAIIGISQDVTKRKEAEEALRLSEEKLRLAVNGADLGTWDWNVQSDQTRCSARTEEMFGLAPGTGRTRDAFLEAVHPEDRGLFAEALQRSIETHTPHEVDYRVVHSDGSIRWIRARGGVRANGDGQVTDMSGTVHDVTERERMKEKLRETEARYHRVAANAPGMIYQFVQRAGGSMEFLYVSEGSRELFGIEPAAIAADANVLVGRIHPADLASFEQSVEESRSSLRDWQWEGRFVRAPGDDLWISGASRPVQHPNGDVVWDGLLTDMTARMKIEEQLQDSAREN